VGGWVHESNHTSRTENFQLGLEVTCATSAATSALVAGEQLAQPQARLQIELGVVVEQLKRATARAAALKVSEEAAVVVVAQTDKPHLKVGSIVFTVPHEKVRVDDAPHPRDLWEQPQLEEELPVLVAVHNVWRQDTQLLQPARA
jgi:hypothetical protein